MNKNLANQLFKQKLKGQTFAFAGSFRYGFERRALATLTAAGARIIADAPATLKYLVVGTSRGVPALRKKAEKINKSGAGTINIVDEDLFLKLITPTREEFLTSFVGDAKKISLWNELQELLRKGAPDTYLYQPGDPPLVDLSGESLKGAFLSRAKLYCVCLDGCDLTAANLARSYFGPLQGANFSNADLSGAHIPMATDCNFTKSNLSGVILDETVATNCDFTKAIFRTSMTASTGNFDACTFCHADMQQCDFEQASFVNAKLGGANLGGSRWDGSDFSGADLTGALLDGGDFTKCKFIGSNLRGAKVRRASLADADFSKAMIDKADFSDSDTLRSKFSGVDVSTSIGLGATLRKGKSTAPGSKMLELDQVSQSSRTIETKIAVTAKGKDQPIKVASEYAGTKRVRIKAYLGNSMQFVVQKDGNYYSNFDRFSDAMRALIGKCPAGGKPKPDSISVKSSKCSLSPKALKQLVIEAWNEAFENQAS